MKTINKMINERSSNRRDILRTKLTAFTKNLYEDRGELVIGDEIVASISDDGGFIFPKGFNSELAKFVVQCYIYGHSDWETDESDYYICIGNPNKGGKEISW